MRPDYHSCEIGLRKPGAACFRFILDDLGLPGEQVLFLDDSEPNVVAASQVGLQPVHHDPAAGAAELRAALGGGV